MSRRAVSEILVKNNYFATNGIKSIIVAYGRQKNEK